MSEFRLDNAAFKLTRGMKWEKDNVAVRILLAKTCLKCFDRVDDPPGFSENLTNNIVILLQGIRLDRNNFREFLLKNKRRRFSCAEGKIDTVHVMHGSLEMQKFSGKLFHF